MAFFHSASSQKHILMPYFCGENFFSFGSLHCNVRRISHTVLLRYTYHIPNFSYSFFQSIIFMYTLMIMIIKTHQTIHYHIIIIISSLIQFHKLNPQTLKQTREMKHN